MPAGPRQLTGDTVASALSAALPGAVATATAEWVEVEPARIAEALRWLHDDAEMDAKQLSNLCAVDRHDFREVLDALSGVGYKGYVTVHQNVADGLDIAEGVKSFADHLRSIGNFD